MLVALSLLSCSQPEVEVSDDVSEATSEESMMQTDLSATDEADLSEDFDDSYEVIYNCDDGRLALTYGSITDAYGNTVPVREDQLVLEEADTRGVGYVMTLIEGSDAMYESEADFGLVLQAHGEGGTLWQNEAVLYENCVAEI